jgi:hypothetical protein
VRKHEDDPTSSDEAFGLAGGHESGRNGLARAREVALPQSRECLQVMAQRAK